MPFVAVLSIIRERGGERVRSLPLRTQRRAGHVARTVLEGFSLTSLNYIGETKMRPLRASSTAIKRSVVIRAFET